MNQGAAQVAPFVLVALIGLQLAELTWQAIPPLETVSSKRPSITQLKTPDKKQTKSATDSALRSLQRFNPWEIPIPRKKKVAKKIKKRRPKKPKEVAIISKLNLKLIGTMVLPGDASRAVLVRKKERRGKQLHLKVGEKVDGATLERIERNEVFFRNGSRLEKISMGEGGVKKNTGKKPSASRKNRANREKSVQKSLSKQNYHAILDKGLKVLKGVNTTPYYQGSKTDGYRLQFKNDRSDFKAFGLTSGDVIRKVNDIPVSDMSRIKQFSKGLKDLSEIRLDILRRDQPESIEIAIGNK